MLEVGPRKVEERFVINLFLFIFTNLFYFLFFFLYWSMLDVKICGKSLIFRRVGCSAKTFFIPVFHSASPLCSTLTVAVACYFSESVSLPHNSISPFLCIFHSQGNFSALLPLSWA